MCDVFLLKNNYDYFKFKLYSLDKNKMIIKNKHKVPSRNGILPTSSRKVVKFQYSGSGFLNNYFTFYSRFRILNFNRSQALQESKISE